MPKVWLDLYELVVAIYLFYTVIKGEGKLYRLGKLSRERQESIRRPLRIFYTVCGVVALMGFGVSVLQSSMFSVNTGMGTVTRSFVLTALPNLSYELLGRIRGILSAVLILMLLCLVAVLMRMSRES